MYVSSKRLLARLLILTLVLHAVMPMFAAYATAAVDQGAHQRTVAGYICGYAVGKQDLRSKHNSGGGQCCAFCTCANSFVAAVASPATFDGCAPYETTVSTLKSSLAVLLHDPPPKALF